ncbi:hypothetical protein D3C72_2428040 [compost metagenome]
MQALVLGVAQGREDGGEDPDETFGNRSGGRFCGVQGSGGHEGIVVGMGLGEGAVGVGHLLQGACRGRSAAGGGLEVVC